MMNYQPTLQFFTSCVEILGKVSADYDDPGYTGTDWSEAFRPEVLFLQATESESESES